MANALRFVPITPWSFNRVDIRHPFTTKSQEEMAYMKNSSLKCQMELVLDSVKSMSRTEKHEAYQRIATVLTDDCWLPPNAELYRHMQNGFGILFQVWAEQESNPLSLMDMTDEVVLIFTTLGRCQFTSELYEIIAQDMAKRFENAQESTELRIKCGTALLFGAFCNSAPNFDQVAKTFFKIAFDQNCALQLKEHSLKLVSICMSHFDQYQMRLFALSDQISSLKDLLNAQEEPIQIAASNCLVFMLKKFTQGSPIPLQDLIEQLKQLAKKNRPIRHNLKFLLVENRIESVVKFKQIRKQININSIEKRVMLGLFQEVFGEDLIRFLVGNESDFVRQMMKPEQLADQSANILVIGLRSVF